MLHVAEVLAERKHRATLRNLAMTCRENFSAALPALYRDINFMTKRWRRATVQALADADDACGGNRHALIRRISNAELLDIAELEVIEKATGLVELSVLISDFGLKPVDVIRDGARRLSRAMAIDQAGFGPLWLSISVSEQVFLENWSYPIHYRAWILRFPSTSMKKSAMPRPTLTCCSIASKLCRICALSA